MALDIKISYSWINYCRLCLQDKGLKIPIFEKEGISENIAVKIKECLNISTYDGDPLPRMICHQCLCKLNTAYELHQKAMESFRLLLTHLQPLKHVPSVHEYMKDCPVSVKSDESVEESPTDSNTAKPSAGRKSGNFSGTTEYVGHQEHDDQIRVTRSRVSGRSSLTPQDSGDLAQKGNITMVPDIGNSSLTAKYLPSTSAASGKEPVFLVPPPPKPKAQGNHFSADHIDYESSEDLSKRKRKRITDYYDEALMDTGGNLVLAAGRTRESRHREGKKKKIGPASRTRALATCLPGPSPWQCVLCSCFFASHNMLRRHLSNCLICQTCGLEFSSAKDKAVHEQEHMYVNLSRYVELLYKCSICDRAFTAHLMLKMHMKYDHPENSVQYVDPNKPSPYVDPESPEDYMDTGDGDSCKCDSGDENKSDQANKIVERTIEGHEICPKCSRPFVTKQRLTYHLLGHDDLIKCAFCPWMFPMGPGRRRHQRRMHGDKADPVCFTCFICKETFETKSILYLHKKSHDKSEPPQEEVPKAENPSKKTELEHCRVCDKMFQPSKFMAHLVHHANNAYEDKPQAEGTVQETDSLQCPICHTTSATQEQHRAHIAQKHIVQKSSTFTCDGCSQAFANVEAINRHSCPGKETEKQWKNCEHCGQNLSDDIIHVCDNECPICHKIFKSARGQRLHIQHKHESPESLSGNADDQANSETRLSEDDSGTPETGVFENLAVKEEKGDVEELVEEDERTAEPETADAPQQPEETEEPSTITLEEPPATTSHAVSDEHCPNPSTENSPVKRDLANTVSLPENSTNAKATPKIRLRPPGVLISDPPPLSALTNVPSTAPKTPGFVAEPPPPYRAPLVTPGSSVRGEMKVTKTVLYRNNSGPVGGYSLVFADTLPSLPAAGNSVPHPGIDHSYTANFVPAPNPSPSVALTLGVGTPVSSVVLAPSFAQPVGSSAYIPLSNSSQTMSNVMSTPSITFSEPATLNQPLPSITVNRQTIICENRPSILPQTQTIRTIQPPMNPLNHGNSIRCVQISSLQGTPVSSTGTFSQSVSQSNVEHGYNKFYNTIHHRPVAPVHTASAHHTVFNPLQPSSGADASEENVLRDVLLGRRIREDIT